MSEARTVTATFITKPACKLIIKRGILSTDYFSYCDEIGCDIWNTLEKVVAYIITIYFLERYPSTKGIPSPYDIFIIPRRGIDISA